MSQLENNTVYMTLNSRGIPGTFHWGLFITTSSAPRGVFYHASNKTGGWQPEFKPTAYLFSSMSLVLVFKIGPISSSDKIDEFLRAVPADGSASLRTDEAFTCRIWMKDALVALHENHVVTLPVDIDTLEAKAFAAGTAHEHRVERTAAKAIVIDSEGRLL
ncbi:uncharacterized protein EAE98_008672 [Botrytis deweyae]|uniref:Uncharacterized protein n=1 Tax=Botrytis deweyae TaxID=2478750 RepID=A0ABQ7IDS7_9HELO|nr:uncharacterized protein EAE98_008672 [Botrytis deweyae]KAF7921246.1 hypothetical protein EAE98_008672 [Botrytis deweyae]